MTDAANESTAETTANSSPSSNWKWFPILWIGGLFAIPAGLQLFGTDVDSGWVNSLIILAVSLSAIGIAVWALLRSNMTRFNRRLVAVIALMVVYMPSPFGPMKLVLDGALGYVGWEWRWAPRADERLASLDSTATVDLWQSTPQDYPRFLGNGHWAEVKGVQLEADWKANPPKKLWQQEIGAGWSSYAIVGKYAITQEQRGEQELVVCYEMLTGDVVWTHADAVRWDPVGPGALGYAGPRATPTIYEGKVFTVGATGILNCLDARSGDVLWTHDTIKKHGAENVMWGKACSPLIVDDMVVVSVGGKKNASLVAYKIDSGDVVWASGKYQSSYASPVLATFAGVRQVVSVDEGFVTSRRADNGKPLWEYKWPSTSDGEAAASQPVPLPEDQLFLSKGYGHGCVLLNISKNETDAWDLQPVWKGGKKSVMKTKMCNVVIHDGYAYGLDDVLLECIDLATGKKKWKERRTPTIGYGQVVLVGDTLLVTTEFGEVVLVEASPKKYHELASIRVFPDDQLTWNTPAFSSPYLLIRNAQQAACYELPVQVGVTTELADKEK